MKCFLILLFLLKASLINATPLPNQLTSALERVEEGWAGAAEERVLRRYVNEAEAGTRVPRLRGQVHDKIYSSSRMR